MNLKDLLIKNKQLLVMEVLDPKIKLAVGEILDIITTSENVVQKDIETDKKISKRILEEFGTILKCIGYGNEHKYVFHSFNSNDSSFVCNVDELASFRILLKNNGYLKNDISMQIITKDQEIEYNFIKLKKYNASIFNLQSYFIKNKCNQNKIYRYLSAEEYNFTLAHDDESIHIDIESSNAKNKNVFKLDNEAILEQYMLNMNKSIDLVEIYEKIIETLVLDITKFPIFRIRVCKTIDGILQVTDLLTIKNGKITSLLRTEGNKTITFNENGWSLTNLNMENDLGNCTDSKTYFTENNNSLDDDLYKNVTEKIENAVKLTRK